MYIIELTYKVSLDRVDSFLESHVDYLNEQYELGHFQASGRKVPRTGGIIFSTLSDRNKLEAIIDKDPFKINNLADYTVTEFVPSKTSEEFNFLKEV